jgi:hypothetical protein
MIDSHPHWVVRSADGTKLATLYTSEATGHGAEFAAEVGGSLTCLIIPGSPCLPLTAPEASAPLAWADVCAEVGAMLAADGWVVCWPTSDTDSAPVWSDQEAEFFDSVADHAYAEGRTEAARNFATERDTLRAERDAALADVTAWRGFAASVAVAVHPGDAGLVIADHLAVDDLPDLLAAVERVVGERAAALAERDSARGERDRLRAEVKRLREAITACADYLPLHPDGAPLTPAEDDGEEVRLHLLAALRGEA